MSDRVGEKQQREHGAVPWEAARGEDAPLAGHATLEQFGRWVNDE